MQITKKKGAFLVLYGLVTISLAIFATPAFAVKYLYSPQDVTPGLLGQLQALRLLLGGLGAVILAAGILSTAVPSEKLSGLLAGMNQALKTETAFLVLIFLGAGLVRFFHIFFVGFSSPYKLGGLFLEFADQIAQNGFLLPRNIPFYTQGGIPFAYPPLPFYIEAFFVHRLGIAPYAVVNLLPPLISLLALPLFYILARAAGLNPWGRRFALAAFAFLPSAFVQQIEGGGLAEASGTFALVWLFIALFQAYKKDSLWRFLHLGLAWAFCVIASPGSAYASVLCFLAFALLAWRGRNFWTVAFRLVLAGVTALVLSSPYWLTVINNHGIAVFTSSLAGQHSDGVFQTLLGNALVKLLNFQMVDSAFAFAWNMLILLGVILGFKQKKVLLLVMFFILVSIPRENAWMVSIPSALFIGIAGEQALLSLNAVVPAAKNRAPVLIAGTLLVVWLAAAPIAEIANSTFSADSAIDAQSLAAMDWLRQNTPPGSPVITLTAAHVQEWVPQVAQRTVINMPYGAEWQPGERASIEKMEEILGSCQSFDCVFAGAKTVLNQDQYLLFASQANLERLRQDPSSKAEFQLMWKNEQIAIGTLRAKGQ